MKNLLLILLLGITLVGCGKKTDDDYLKSAKESVDNNNIPEAVTAYENLIKEYPQSPKAPEAIFQLASLYQNKMVKSVDEKASLLKAVDLFKSIYEKYPDSHLAPKSLFMSGFILANDLNDFDKATSTFNLFLQKFPNDALASSAKEELDNMGLSPEEILKKKSS